MMEPSGTISMVSRSRPESLDEKFPHYIKLEDAINDQTKCVFVCNPSVFHLEAAKTALEKGCHVFCEKPLSVNLEGVDKLVELAMRNDRVVFVGYNLRFHASLLEIKRRLSSHAIGKPVTLFLEVGQALMDWRPGLDYRESVSAQRALGGGALLELSHEIDIAFWLTGKPLIKMFGIVGKSGELDLDVEDFASLTMQFEGSATAMLHLDFLQRPGGRKYRIIGTRGSLAWDSNDALVRETCFSTGKISEEIVAGSRDPNHSYLAQLSKFRDLVRLDRYDASHLEGGIKVLKCLDQFGNQ